MFLKTLSDYFRDLTYWAWFALGISLLPLLFRIWHLFGNGDNKSLMEACQETFVDGDLMLICMALVGGSIAELIDGNTNHQGTRAILVGSCLLLTIWTGLVYSDVAEGTQLASKVFNVSMGTLIATISICASSLTLPKE
jgi:hypothetical protein